MTIEFKAWPKIARLNRDIVITEKIDGTNAAIGITDEGEVYAQSRTRLVTPEKDNFGFARWVADHGVKLTELLGPGLHFGEWWGNGIQRGYGMQSKVFSLFNTARYGANGPDTFWSAFPGIRVVPVLYEGPFDTYAIEYALNRLSDNGSYAAPGYMNPEGIVVFHTAASTMFKVTLEGDEKPKGEALAALQEAASH